MHFVGIDIAKELNFACIVDDAGNIECEGFSFANDGYGFRQFVNLLELVDDDRATFLIACESTGHYHVNLHERLHALGYSVSVVNPLNTDAFRKVLTMRKTKTDSVDARLIAEYARYSRPAVTVPKTGDMEALRNLTRYRTQLVMQRTQLKNRANAVIDRIFPELPKLLGGLWSATFRNLLEQMPDLSTLANADVDGLALMLSQSSRGRFGIDKASDIINAALCTSGNFDSVLTFELRHIFQMVGFYDDKISEIDHECDLLLSETDAKHLTSIPGLGVVLASIIASELMDADRFENQKKVIAFAGMDATKHQSGNFEGTKEHMSKRGSSHLRYALMSAADSVRRFEPSFGAYYDSLKARGKHHYVALSAVARKLASVILVLWKEQRPFEQRA